MQLFVSVKICSGKERPQLLFSSDEPEGIKRKANNGTNSLVTFMLVAYNQERYIRKAVESAFSQTCTPLEIILSDDCSSDRTFEIMQEMAADYTGHHKIILNQNKSTEGLCAHINRCMELSHGELIVGAAGDDISFPDRAAVLYRAWEDSGRIPSSLFSNVVIINDDGAESDLWFPSPPIYTKNIDAFKQNRRSWVTGCSHAFTRGIFTKYGRVNPNVIQEDGVLPFRSLLEGGVLYVDKVLVKYRRHAGNVYNPGDPAKHIALQRKEYTLKQSWLFDAERSNHKDKQLIAVLKQEYAKSLLKMVFYSTPLLAISYEKIKRRLRIVRNSCRTLVRK
jgi:glycosyltransferase involved in cell wall biosynthesis